MVECPDCGKEFDTERGMKIHKTRVHTESKEEKTEKEPQEQEEQAWYRERNSKIAIATAIIIITIISLTVLLRPIEPIENGTDSTIDLNITNGENETVGENETLEDFYRPPENTLYFICDFENETTKEERCIDNLITARTFAEERNISFVRRDTRANQSVDIMKGAGVARYPLWVYNTEETPEDKYCALVGGPVNNYILQEFIDHCEEFGTLEKGHFEL